MITSAIPRRTVMTLPERLTAQVSQDRQASTPWTVSSTLVSRRSMLVKVPARSTAFTDSPGLKVPLVPPVLVLCQRGSLPVQSAHSNRQGHHGHELRDGQARERNQPDAY